MSWRAFIPDVVKLNVKRIYYKTKFPTLKVSSGVDVSFDSTFEEGVTLYRNVKIINSTLGRYTYVAERSRLANTYVGRFCSIGPEVLCGLGIHPTRDIVSTHPSFFSTAGQSQIVFTNENCFEETKEVKIGHDVWIGARAIINDGVEIGNGAIVGAGAFVNKNVPPYAIVAGVPSKIIRYRFTPHQIELLDDIKWWDWEIEKIKSNQRLFKNINLFTEVKITNKEGKV